jgi:hypothetical protein
MNHTGTSHYGFSAERVISNFAQKRAEFLAFGHAKFSPNVLPMCFNSAFSDTELHCDFFCSQM